MDFKWAKFFLLHRDSYRFIWIFAVVLFSFDSIFKSMSNTESGGKTSLQGEHLLGIFNEMENSSNAIIHFILFAFYRWLDRLSDYWLRVLDTGYWQLETIQICMSSTQEQKNELKECLDWWFNGTKSLARGRSSAKLHTYSIW